MTYKEKLQHPKWQKKRLEILQRDEFKCKNCGQTEMQLHVHHLSYSKGNDPWDYPNENFATLCKSCHESEHKEIQYRWIYDMIREELKFNPGDNLYKIIKGDKTRIGHKFDMSGYGESVTSDNMNILFKFESLGIFDYTEFLFVDFYKGSGKIYLKYWDAEYYEYDGLCGLSTSEIIFKIFMLTIFSGRQKRRRDW